MLRIRTLWLLGLAAGASIAASGCVVGDGGNSDSSFVVDWSLAYVGSNEAVECDEAGTPTVDLDIQNLQTKEINHTPYTCMAHAARSPVFPPGQYEVAISLKDAAGNVVSTNSGQFGLQRRQTTDLGSLVFGIQSFELFWSIRKANATAGCDQVGAKSVRLSTQLPSQTMPTTYLFPCASGQGQTTAIPLGTYAVQVELLDAANQPLGQVLSMTVPVTDKARASLEPITFNLP